MTQSLGVSARDGAETDLRRCPVCGASYPADFVVCPKDASTLEREGGDPLVGEVLAGTFCVTRLLAAGGMGRVYEAEHVRLPRRFAVKVMHEALAQHAEAMGRFEREAQAIARIVNEHVIDVVDLVRTRDGYPCLVAELLEGEELGNLLERTGKVPLATAITIARQICRGLVAAHAVGVIHRDLKPSNLFLVKRVDGATQVKILDFGVAKVSDGADLTRTGMIVGTPAYMAPEQARGSAKVDERVDVYAVGAVLYRMLTGRPPFPEDEEPARTVARLLAEDPKRPRDLDREIPAEVEFLVQRAMARSPGDRPQTAMALEHELARLDGEGSARGIAGAPSSQVVIHSQKGETALASMDTVLSAARLDRHAAEDAVKRVRRARPAAMGLAIGVGLAVGSAVFISAAGLLQLIANRPVVTNMEKLLIAVLSGLCMITAASASLRVLVSRWRSGYAVERLAAGLRRAVVTLLATGGVLAFAWRGYTLLGPPLPSRWLPFIDIGMVLGPTLISAVTLVFALRHAEGRH